MRSEAERCSTARERHHQRNNATAHSTATSETLAASPYRIQYASVCNYSEGHLLRKAVAQVKLFENRVDDRSCKDFNAPRWSFFRSVYRHTAGGRNRQRVEDGDRSAGRIFPCPVSQRFLRVSNQVEVDRHVVLRQLTTSPISRLTDCRLLASITRRRLQMLHGPSQASWRRAPRVAFALFGARRRQQLQQPKRLASDGARKLPRYTDLRYFGPL